LTNPPDSAMIASAAGENESGGNLQRGEQQI